MAIDTNVVNPNDDRLHVNNANLKPQAPGANVTSTSTNPFMKFFHEVGQFVVGHRQFAEDIAVTLDNDTVREAAKLVLVDVAVLVKLVADGVALKGQSIMTNPNAFAALEKLVGDFNTYVKSLPSDAITVGEPTETVVETAIPVSVVPVDSPEPAGSSSESGDDWTKSGDGTDYPRPVSDVPRPNPNPFLASTPTEATTNEPANG